MQTQKLAAPTTIHKFAFFAVVVAMVSLLPADSALAFEAAKNFMTKIKDILVAMSVIVVTVAIIWSGYKMIFQGASFRDIAPILIGGFIIGASSAIAQMLISSGG